MSIGRWLTARGTFWSLRGLSARTTATNEKSACTSFFQISASRRCANISANYSASLRYRKVRQSTRATSEEFSARNMKWIYERGRQLRRPSISLGYGVALGRPKARRIEPIIHMCSRFNLAGLFQGGVAKCATDQLRLFTQVLSLFQKAFFQRFCLLFVCLMRRRLMVRSFPSEEGGSA